MARRPRDLPEPPLQFIDDGLTDEAREAALASWLAELDHLSAIDVGVRAADTLAEARAEGEI